MSSEPETKTASAAPDAIAPDQSEIRLLAGSSRGSSAHVTLRAGQISLPVAHHTVEEIWYTLAGDGEFWRNADGRETTIPVRAGVSFSIPVGTRFQFRNTGTEPLTFFIVTMPPWPGEAEAYSVPGHWAVTEPS